MSIHVKTAAGWEELGVSGDDGDCDLVGGVAGWAAIESVTGTASLDDLKAANIAPATATEDTACPGTYNIVGDDGVVYRVAVWTDPTQTHKLKTQAGGLVDCFLISKGGSKEDREGSGGRVVQGLQKISSGESTVKIGFTAPSVTGKTSKVGEDSSLGSITTGVSSYAYGGAGGTSVNTEAEITSSITGVEVGFGQSGLVGSPRANRGDGGTTGSGSSGIVIVRVPKDAANNPKPDAPVAWGKFNSVPTGFTDEGAYGPDAQGRMWKWYEFADPGDFTIDLSGGQYWVLTVGGGSNGWNSTGYLDSGQPGLVNEGYWEFNNGPTPIKVGAKGTTADTLGFPSSIGSYGTQGIVTWGNDFTGRGSTAYQDQKGYTSYIRDGQPATFATGSNGVDSPGRADKYGGSGGRPGCVIIATVTNDPNTWNPPGALPGIGGWATITSVTGMPNRYSYGDWVAFEWTADGSLTTQAGGLVDALVLGAGGVGRPGALGGGGGLLVGLHSLPSGESLATIAQPNASAYADVGAPSTLGPLNSGYSTRHRGSLGVQSGYPSSITGTEQEYGKGSPPTSGAPRPNKGDGNDVHGASGSSGVCIVRVPAAQAAGVDPATYNDVTVRSVAKEKAKEAVKSEIKSRRKKK